MLLHFFAFSLKQKIMPLAAIAASGIIFYSSPQVKKCKSPVKKHVPLYIVQFPTLMPPSNTTLGLEGTAKKHAPFTLQSFLPNLTLCGKRFEWTSKIHFTLNIVVSQPIKHICIFMKGLFRSMPLQHCTVSFPIRYFEHLDNYEINKSKIQRTHHSKKHLISILYISILIHFFFILLLLVSNIEYPYFILSLLQLIHL